MYALLMYAERICALILFFSFATLSLSLSLSLFLFLSCFFSRGMAWRYCTAICSLPNLSDFWLWCGDVIKENCGCILYHSCIYYYGGP